VDKALQISYRLSFEDGSQREIDLRFDSRTLERIDIEADDPPAWTALTFEQCRNCPLAADDHPHCPAALSVMKLVSGCAGMFSYTDVHVTVTTPERITSGNTTLQRAISSLLGLSMSTSGCPHTVFFKPMARFHLPLAGEEETIYRATSMYMLAQYFLIKDGREPDTDLSGLVDIYQAMQVVNTAMAKRLRAASDKDAAVNAIVNLDLFAKAMPYSVEESLEEIRYLFTPYLGG
jgi:hypothetical protein